jgi:hypothetical protein
LRGACAVSTHAVLKWITQTGTTRVNVQQSGYNLAAADDPGVKRPLAALNFLDRLNDLDHGLHGGARPSPAPSAPPAARAGAIASAARQPAFASHDTVTLDTGANTSSLLAAILRRNHLVMRPTLVSPARRLDRHTVSSLVLQPLGSSRRCGPATNELSTPRVTSPI